MFEFSIAPSQQIASRTNFNKPNVSIKPSIKPSNTKVKIHKMILILWVIWYFSHECFWSWMFEILIAYFNHRERKKMGLYGEGIHQWNKMGNWWWSKREYDISLPQEVPLTSQERGGEGWVEGSSRQSKEGSKFTNDFTKTNDITWSTQALVRPQPEKSISWIFSSPWRQS